VVDQEKWLGSVRIFFCERTSLLNSWKNSQIPEAVSYDHVLADLVRRMSLDSGSMMPERKVSWIRNALEWVSHTIGGLERVEGMRKRYRKARLHFPSLSSSLASSIFDPMPGPMMCVPMKSVISYSGCSSGPKTLFRKLAKDVWRPVILRQMNVTVILDGKGLAAVF